VGLFGDDKPDEEMLSEFINDGYRCAAVIGSVGHSGGMRAASTLLFGFVGMAATMGQKEEKAPRRLFMRDKGLRFISKEDKFMEIRIPWENVVHVGSSHNGDRLYVYTDNEGSVIFSMQITKRADLCKKFIETQCNLIKDDLEGCNNLPPQFYWLWWFCIPR